MEAPGERSDLRNLSIADETSQSREIIGAEGRATGHQGQSGGAGRVPAVARIYVKWQRVILRLWCRHSKSLRGNPGATGKGRNLWSPLSSAQRIMHRSVLLTLREKRSLLARIFVEGGQDEPDYPF